MERGCRQTHVTAVAGKSLQKSSGMFTGPNHPEKEFFYEGSAICDSVPSHQREPRQPSFFGREFRLFIDFQRRASKLQMLSIEYYR